MRNNKQRFLVFGLLVLVILVLSTTLLAQDDTTLTASVVDAMDISPLDVVWNDAPTLAVALEQQSEDGVPDMTIDLQAVHTGDTLYIRAVWRDDTLNNQRRLWHYDGEVWTRGDKVDGIYGNEDRLGITFDINGGREYAALGCGAICHTSDDLDYMGYEEDGYDGESVDMWHWKASRTAPAGYADDQSAGMVSYEDPDEVTGRSGDSRDSGSYSDNKNEAGDGPGFTYPDGITSGALLKADAVPIDGMTFEAGTTIPYYLLERPVGSRGDIGASSYYVQDVTGGGWWYVVMSRAFDTGNDDDGVLTLGGEHVIGVAVFDNGGGKKHAVYGDPLLLVINE
jgi:hypothetical protein